MSARLRIALLVAEAAICFALPAYFLFWGIVAAPILLFSAMRGGTYAAWSLSNVVAGCLGIVALVSFLRYLTSQDNRREFAMARNTAFGISGLLAIWSTVTERFKYFDADVFTLVAAMLPSLCFLHFLALALRRSKSKVVT